MEGKRITLDFSEPVYQNESRIWYFLNYERTATIKDVVLDLTRKLNCGTEWSVYINDIISPEWVSTHVISSEQDSVTLIRPSNRKCIPSKNGDDQLEHSITVVDNHHNISTTVDQKDIPLTNLPLKINNNFKRKFSSTTSTSRDRYTNRSKIYVSPVLPKRSKSSVPVATALKTAVKETLDFSSLTRTTPSNSFSCQTATVTDSMQKATIFQDKVTSLLNKSKPVVKIESVSDSDSSMTSDSSSEDEEVKKPSKVAKVSVESKPSPKVLKKPTPSSSESESVPETMVKQSDTKVLKKPTPSSSESESEPETHMKKSDTKILKKPTTSSSESESEPETMVKQSDTKILKKPIPSSSESESEPETHMKKSNTKSEKESNKESLDIEMEESDAEKVTSTLDKDESSKTENQSKENGKSSSDSDNENKTADMDSQDKSEVGNKDYSSFIGLQGAPRVSDKVAFKMLDLNESYCPVISEYKEGVVTGYDSHSQSIVLKLLPPFNTFKRKPGKFELDDSLCTTNSLELNLKQLIEPKLLS